MGQSQHNHQQFVSCLKSGNRAWVLLSMAIVGVASTAIAAQAGPAQPQVAAPYSAIEIPAAVEPVTGRLIARDVDGQVNIRVQPSLRSPILTQGDNQAPLYIFKSALTPQGERWYLIENVPTGTQGWVHGDYVRLNQPARPFPSAPRGGIKIDPNSMTAQWTPRYQVEERPEQGILTARDADAWINVRSQTNTDSAIRHRGQPGEPVYIYRSAHFSSPAGRVRIRQVWHYVALLESGVEGWVLNDYVASAWESDEPFDVGWRSPKSGQLIALKNADSVPLYEFTSRQSPVLKTLQSGQSITLLRKLATVRGAIEGVWYEVELADGTKGWVHGPNVRKVV